MKRSKALEIGQWIIAFSFVFWLCETAYFGWNLKPINSNEEFCDHLVNIGFAIGLMVMLTPGIYHYTKWLKRDA